MRSISIDDRCYASIRNIKTLHRKVLSSIIFENSNQFTFFTTNVLGVQFASIHLKLNSESERERWSHFGGT